MMSLISPSLFVSVPEKCIPSHEALRTWSNALFELAGRSSDSNWYPETFYSGFASEMFARGGY
jgi:hypothetical protein